MDPTRNVAAARMQLDLAHTGLRYAESLEQRTREWENLRRAQHDWDLLTIRAE